MGLRFRKRITLVPGVRVNLGLKGASLSLGPRGASVSISSRGVYGNIGLPGTGLSYRTRLDSGKKRRKGQINSSDSSCSEEIHLVITDTGIVEAHNEQGLRMPSRYVKEAEQMNPSGFQIFLQNECDAVNTLSKELSGLVLTIPEPKYRPTLLNRPFTTPQPKKDINPVTIPDAPTAPQPPVVTWLDKILPFLQSQKTIRYENDMQEYSQALEKYKYLQNQHVIEQTRIDRSYENTLTNYSNLRQKHELETRDLQEKREHLLREDADTIYEVFEDAIREVAWPRETVVAFSIHDSGRLIFIDVDLPEIEDFPVSEAIIDGQRLRIKKFPLTAQRSLYAHHIGSIGLLLCGIAFSRLPGIRQVVVSAYSQRTNRATGVINDEYLYSCVMSRRNFSQINFSGLDKLDPMEALALGNLRCNKTKTNLFKPIEPFNESDLTCG